MSKAKILVLEDDERLGTYIRKCLEQCDYEVADLVDTGQAAVDAAWNTLPDLALLDIYVPGDMDGIDAGAIIRRDLDIPVVFQTGYFDEDTLERAMNVDPLGYLLKPFNHLNLQTTIDNALHQHRATLKRTRALVAAMEKRYQEMFENSPLGIGRMDLSGHLVNANASLAKTLGYESVQALMESVENVGTDMFADAEDSRSIFDLLRQQALVSAFESRLRCANGSEIWGSINARLTKDVGRMEDCYECIVQDITGKRKAEEALRISEERLTCLVNAARDGISMTDGTGNVLLWNQTIQKITGYSEAEALGKNLNELITPERYRIDYQKAFVDWLASATGDEIGQTIESTAMRKDHTEFPVELSLSAVRQNGHWTSIGILRDISERMQAKTERDHMEVTLRQAQKLESIGQLAAGIAHEINTPTQYVGDNTRFLLDAFRDVNSALQTYGQMLDACRDDSVSPDLIKRVEAVLHSADLDYLSSEIPKAITQSLDGIERIATIVRAMKNFSHPGSKDMTPTDIHRAIQNTLIVCRNEYKYVADVATQFDESLPLVPCIPGDFNQVIMNLVINAAHAIADKVGSQPNAKGKISIATHNKGDVAEIRISDTGAGIPEEIQGKVYDPFFTTKDIGRGTGQGLAICHAVIVQQHKGSIRFESEIGKGTTFVVCLPLDSVGRNEEVA